jgi:hypothetical protein
MESNFSELNLRELFLYTPYDHLYDSRAILSEEDFINKLRIIPDAYKDLRDNLKQSIRDNTYTILSGYAGNGKTTFLYWFKEEIKDSYTVDIINVIKHGVGFALDHTLVEKCLEHELWDRLDVETFKIIGKNRNIFSVYFDTKSLDSITNYYQRCNNESKDRELFNDVFIDTKFSHKLILFLFNAILMQLKGKTELNGIKPYLLCFDNLDELKIEYFTDDIWENVLDAMSKLNSIFSEIEETKNFNHTLKISLLFVFREANFAVGAAQANDRLSHITKEIRFFYTNSGLKIAKKRLDVYNEYRYHRRNIQTEWYSNDERIYDLTAIIIEDKVLMNERLMPLFNYDYRQFSDAVVNISTPKAISGKLYSLFMMTKEQYDAFPNDKLMRNGKRGILMNTFIRHLSDVNFLERIVPKTDIVDKKRHCNYVRMFLTVLCNLSFGNRTEKQRNEKAESEPTQVSIIEIYKYCKKIMTVNEFFDTIESLIDFNKSSWAHLITIYNKMPYPAQNNSYKFDFSREIKSLNEKIVPEDLKKISISANASAYIYLRYILTHFEYIAAYKANSNKDSIYDYKPLFMCTDINLKDSKWEFEKTIENVYTIVKAYSVRTRNFFKEIFIEKLKYTPEKYCASDSVYIFKGDYDDRIGQNKPFYPFYMTRLLTTHIRYLDDFRLYINKYCDAKIQNTLNEITDKRLTVNFKNKEAINSFILSFIEKYVVLLEEIQDPAIGKGIINKFKENLEEAKRNPILIVEFEELTIKEMIK